MDLEKVPIEKLWSFVAAVIPGSAAMLIFRLSHPEAFSWLLKSTAFGYRTKLVFLVAIALIAGSTVVGALNFLAGALGGVLGSLKYKPSTDFDVAPWRDPRWRSLVAKTLGPDLAPENMPWIPKAVIASRQQAVEFMPEEQRPLALNELILERLNAVSNDGEWRQWYDHYQQLLPESTEEPFTWHLRVGLRTNLQATSIYVSHQLIIRTSSAALVVSRSCALLVRLGNCRNGRCAAEGIGSMVELIEPNKISRGTIASS